MKIKFAQYEHTCIGFPKIILKWSETDGKSHDPYITIKDIISDKNVQSSYEQLNTPKYWMERFEEWVGRTFCDDASVQG